MSLSTHSCLPSSHTSLVLLRCVAYRIRWNFRGGFNFAYFASPLPFARLKAMEISFSNPHSINQKIANSMIYEFKTHENVVFLCICELSPSRKFQCMRYVAVNLNNFVFFSSIFHWFCCILHNQTSLMLDIFLHLSHTYVLNSFLIYHIREIFYIAFNLTMRKNRKVKTPTVVCVCTHLMFNNYIE